MLYYVIHINEILTMHICVPVYRKILYSYALQMYKSANKIMHYTVVATVIKQQIGVFAFTSHQIISCF